MEIVLVVIVLLVVAAAAYIYMTGDRRAGQGRPGRRTAGPSLTGARHSRRASRHDPLAVAVVRHAQAVDPHEAAREEQNLQAQARRVAADLQARQAQQPDHSAAELDTRRAYATPQPYVDPRVGRDGNGHAGPGSDEYGRPGGSSAPPAHADPAGPPDPAAR